MGDPLLPLSLAALKKMNSSVRSRLTFLLLMIVVATCCSCVKSKKPLLNPSTSIFQNSDSVELLHYTFMDAIWRRAKFLATLSKAEGGWYILDAIHDDGKKYRDKMQFEEIGNGFFVQMSPNKIDEPQFYIYQFYYLDSQKKFLYVWHLSLLNRSFGERKTIPVHVACLLGRIPTIEEIEKSKDIEYSDRAALLSYFKSCANFVFEKRVAPNSRIEVISLK